MTVHEYLQLIGIKENSYQQLAFQIAECKKETEHIGYCVYHSSPIRNIRTWYNLDYTDPKKRVRAKILDYIVLNPRTYLLNWLSGVNWNNAISHGRLLMMLVISQEELHKCYSPEQAAEIVSFIDKEIRKQIT